MDEFECIEALTRAPAYAELRQLSERRRPNIFDKLSEIFSENCSSRFLRYLLDAGEDHGLGSTATRELINMLPSSERIRFRTALDLAATVRARFNWRTHEGRYLDILVLGEDERGRPVFAIGIENKIFADEGINQIQAYQIALRSTFGETVPTILVFLTMRGCPPKTTPGNETCKVVSMSHAGISTGLRNLLSMPGLYPQIHLLIDSYIKHITGDTELEQSAHKLVLELLKDPRHREAINLIQKYAPTYREVLEGLKLRDGAESKLSIELRWTYPARSSFPHEVNFSVGTLNEQLHRALTKPTEKSGVYFMLLANNARLEARQVTIGDEVSVQLMVFEDARKILLSSDIASLPKSSREPAKWGAWECLWVGPQYRLVDLGESDINGLSDLLTEAVEVCYEPIRRLLTVQT